MIRTGIQFLFDSTKGWPNPLTLQIKLLEQRKDEDGSYLVGVEHVNIDWPMNKVTANANLVNLAFTSLAKLVRAYRHRRKTNANVSV